jgi:hypothetical protein
VNTPSATKITTALSYRQTDIRTAKMPTNLNVITFHIDTHVSPIFLNPMLKLKPYIRVKPTENASRNTTNGIITDSNSKVNPPRMPKST